MDTTGIQAVDTARTAALRMPTQIKPQGSREAMREAAQDFEAMFLSQMLSHMFEGVEVDKEFGGGQGEEVFRSVLVGEYGKEMARAGGIGLARQLEAQLLQLQEVRS